MITATVKPYSQLTAEEESQWYDANHQLIEWDETPEQAYERLNAHKLDEEKSNWIRQSGLNIGLFLLFIEEWGKDNDHIINFIKSVKFITNYVDYLGVEHKAKLTSEINTILKYLKTNLSAYDKVKKSCGILLMKLR